MSGEIINLIGKIISNKTSDTKSTDSEQSTLGSFVGSLFESFIQTDKTGKSTSATTSSGKIAGIDTDEVLNIINGIKENLLSSGSSESSSKTAASAKSSSSGTSASSQVSSLRDTYTKLQSEEGIVSKAAGWVKNLFGLKSSPSYVENQLSALEQKISSGQSVSQSEIDSVNDLIANYSNRSEDGSNTVAAATGLGVGASCGAAIGTALFPGVGTVIGGILGGFVGGFAAGSATKVALEQLDNVTDTTEGNAFDVDDMVEDGIQGGLIGGTSGALGGTMGATGATTNMTASSINGTAKVLNNIVTLYTDEQVDSSTTESERKSSANTLGSFMKSLLSILLKSAK